MTMLDVQSLDNRATVLTFAVILAMVIYKQIKNSTSISTTAPAAASVPNPLPPGSIKSMSAFRECIRAEKQMATVDKYGNVFMVKNSFPGIVSSLIIVNDPSIVKELTIRQMNQYHDPYYFSTRADRYCKHIQQVLGKGVTGLKGEEWRWRKVALLKAFHKSTMMNPKRALLDVVLKEGRQLCLELDKAASDGEAVAVDLLTTKAAAGVILFFLFGRQLEFDSKEMRESATLLMECLVTMLSNPLYNMQKYVPGTKASKLEEEKFQAHKIIDSIVAPEIQRLLDEHTGKIPVHSERKPGSVIATLIEQEPRFLEGGVESMIAEARVLVLAGFDTTAHSVAFALGMLAQRKDLAESLALEGKRILETGSSNFIYSSNVVQQGMNDASIYKNFFLESTRLYPLIPTMRGECRQDINVKSSDGTSYRFPKGASIFFPNVALQRHVENPEEIRPDRWDVPMCQQPFLHTFQNGPHACPGKPLSLLESQVFLMLAATHFEFDFISGKKVEFEESILLRPKNGMPLLVKRRT